MAADPPDSFYLDAPSVAYYWEEHVKKKGDVAQATRSPRTGCSITDVPLGTPLSLPGSAGSESGSSHLSRPGGQGVLSQQRDLAVAQDISWFLCPLSRMREVVPLGPLRRSQLGSFVPFALGEPGLYLAD